MGKREELLLLAERVEDGSDGDTRLLGDIARAIAPIGDPSGLLTSIDTVEELREVLLPGSRVRVSQLPFAGDWSVDLSTSDSECVKIWRAASNHECRARLAAVLRAYADGKG